MPVNAYSNYPGGFSHGVTIRGMPVLTVPDGNAWYVHSGTGSDSGGSNGSINQPFATLDFAIGRATANNGDVIYLKSGHAETITSATTMLWDVAGISIVSLGVGARRATFTFTTANTARIPVSAANISVQNCIFVGNFLSIATCFLLTTAPEFTVDNCEFRDTSAVLGFLSILTTTVTVNADGLTFTNNKVQSDATTTPGPAVVIAGTIDRLNISYNYIVHSVANNNVAKLLNHGALVITHGMVAYNAIYCIDTAATTAGLLIETAATTGSGVYMYNFIRSQDPSATIIITAAAVQWAGHQNYHTGETTQLQGFLLPAAGTDA